MSGRVITETTRLVLREFERDDLDDLAALLADPVVMRFWPRPYTHEEAKARLERILASYAQDGFGLWAVELRESGQFVGRCGLLHQTVNGVPELEIAYMIASACWRLGLATEAACGIRDWAFTHLRPERLISLIALDNVPSMGVAANAGMVRTGAHVHFDEPHAVYSISRKEWEELHRE